MALLLSYNRQAYGFLYVIFSGVVIVSIGGAGGIALRLCRSVGLSVSVGAGADIGAGLHHYGPGYSGYRVFSVCAGGTRSGIGISASQNNL